MTNRPICPKGQRKTGSPCIFCQDGSYCAHQYYCPATRRYENSGWRGCRKMASSVTANAVPPSPKGEGLAAAAGMRGGEDTAPYGEASVGRDDTGAPSVGADNIRPDTPAEDSGRMISAPTEERQPSVGADVPIGPQETKKEVTPNGAKKVNRRKSRKG